MQDKTVRPSRRAILAGALAFGAAPAVIRSVSAQTAQGVSPQLAELYEKAKAEREVSIWAPGSPSVEWIPAEFAKRFPGIKVTWLGDQQASSRLIAEQRAGRHATDVWTYSLGGTLEVQKRGLLEKYDWRQFGAQDRDIFWDGEVDRQAGVGELSVAAAGRLSRDRMGPRANAEVGQGADRRPQTHDHHLRR